MINNTGQSEANIRQMKRNNSYRLNHLLLPDLKPKSKLGLLKSKNLRTI